MGLSCDPGWVGFISVISVARCFGCVFSESHLQKVPMMKKTYHYPPVSTDIWRNRCRKKVEKKKGVGIATRWKAPLSRTTGLRPETKPIVGWHQPFQGKWVKNTENRENSTLNRTRAPYNFSLKSKNLITASCSSILISWVWLRISLQPGTTRKISEDRRLRFRLKLP